MIENKECERIIREYYREIYNYCFAKLSFSKQAAEDCAQETFLALHTKRGHLDSDNIRAWLYRTADNVMKNYLRKAPPDGISLDDAPEIPDTADPPDISRESVLDVLTDEERRILETYATHGYGERREAARELGMTLPAMYQRIHRIKQKLKKR